MKTPTPDEFDVLATAILTDVTYALQDAFKNSGLTCEDIAERLGMSVARVRFYLDGTARQISVRQMVNLFLAMGHRVEIKVKKGSEDDQSR